MWSFYALPSFQTISCFYLFFLMEMATLQFWTDNLLIQWLHILTVYLPPRQHPVPPPRRTRVSPELHGGQPSSPSPPPSNCRFFVQLRRKATTPRLDLAQPPPSPPRPRTARTPSHHLDCLPPLAGPFSLELGEREREREMRNSPPES